MVKKVLKVKTDYGIYECIFTPAKDVGGYVVEARGLRNGAFTQGRTLTEAKAMIKDAIEGMIEVQAISKAEEEGIVKVKRGQFAHIA